MRKRILSILLALVLCLSLGAAAALAEEPGTDPPAIVSVTINGNATYYADLNGINTLIDKNTATIDLLADASGNISVENALTTLTLNLNGHTMTGGLTVTSGTVEVNANGGKLDGAVSLTGGELTLNGGTYSGNVTMTLGSLKITGGTFNGTVDLGSTGTARLTGGTFNELKAGNDLKTYLAEDCAFAATTNGSGVGESAMTNLGDVKVIAHHSGDHTDAGENGVCDFCGKNLVASITKGGGTKQYFESFASALENVQTEQTLKLLRHTSLTSDTRISNKSFTLDLSNREISVSNKFPNVTLTIASGATLTLKGTTDGKLTVPITVNGTLTAEDAVGLGNVSVPTGGNIAVDADAKFTSLSITGGTFTTLSVGTSETLKDKSFLGTGRAYYDNTSRKWLTDADLEVQSLSNVSVKELPIKSVKLKASSDSVAYNTPVTLAAAVTQNGSDPITYTWQEKTGETWTKLSDGAATYPVSPTVGTHIYRCVAAADGCTVISNEVTVTVNKATVTTNGPTANTGLTYNAREQALVLAPATLPKGTAVQYRLSQSDSWSNTIPTATNAGTYTVYWKVGDGGVNYEDYIPAQPVRVTIAPNDISNGMQTAIVAASVPDLTYNGQPQTPSPVLKLQSKGDNNSAVVEYETLKAGTDYTVTAAPQTNVGDNYELTITGKGNYTGTMPGSWSIKKASFSGGSFNYGVSVKQNTAHSYTYDLGTFLPGLPAGCSYGQISYAITRDMTPSDYYDRASATISGSTLTLPIKSAQVNGKTDTLIITATTDNYDHIELRISPTFIEGTPLKGVPTLSRTSLTYGETLSAITLSGTMTDAITGASVPGTFSWNSPEYTGAGVGLMKGVWDFRITGSNSDHPDASGAVHLTVLKATPTGAPTYTPITTAGKKLSDANLQTGSIAPAGTIAWELGGDTVVAANTAYQWIFTPTDGNNYNTLTGSITLYPVSAPAPTPSTPSGGGSSGGSSSSDGSSTPAGTVTVPVSSDSGKVEVKADVSKDGTATVDISDKQIESVAQHGSGTVMVDVSGLKDVESVKVPSHVVDTTNQAADTGLTVALPGGTVSLDNTALESVSNGQDVTVSVQRVPATDLNEAQQKAVGDMANIGLVVDVDLTVGSAKQSTFNGGKLTISVPYTPKRGEDTRKLTVWFIHDDGTIERKGGYYDDAKGCFVFETEHLSRYVLVYDNDAPAFTDVPVNAYFYDAVRWAASNGITGGVTETTFAPNQPCTRAQIVTFLYRYAVTSGMDVSVGEDTNILSYNDALEIPEYAVPAFQWACGAGITQGSSGNLMPNRPCTRAQAVAFLYRFAALTGMDAVTTQELVSGFGDAAQVPSYALAPFNWALAKGVVQGSGGNLMPNQPCTRAQIVTFLYRMLGK